jgi:hypothetical protein
VIAPFTRIVQIVCASETGLIAVLEAYIDESGREQQSQVFGVSGYAFYPGMAIKFVDAWKPLWGGRVFHMKEFVALQGAFRGMDRAEQSRLIKEAVEVINAHIDSVFAFPVMSMRLSISHLDGFGDSEMPMLFARTWLCARWD